MRRSTSVFQASLPTSQSKLLVWRERSLGTSRGSVIFAKEMRRGARGFSMVLLVLREAAKRGPSKGSRDVVDKAIGERTTLDWNSCYFVAARGPGRGGA